MLLDEMQSQQYVWHLQYSVSFSYLSIFSSNAVWIHLERDDVEQVNSSHTDIYECMSSEPDTDD